jgi:hypothetical protein
MLNKAAPACIFASALINFKTAKTLGFTIPSSLLATADELIEQGRRLLPRMSLLLAPLRHADGP